MTPPLVDEYYQIGTVEDLLWFAEQVNAGHVTYNAKLTADIDLSGVTWTSMGTSSNIYSGIFDGNGYAISNFDTAIFGDIGTAKIVRLGADNKAKSSFQIQLRGGILINRIVGSNCEIDSCYILFDRATISPANAGIIAPFGAAQNSGSSASISNSYVIGNYFGGTVPSGDSWINVGGLIGQQSHSVIVNNCYTKIDTLVSNRVQSYSYSVGGLCGVVSPYTGQGVIQIANTVSIINTYTTGYTFDLRYRRISEIGTVANCYALYPNNRGTSSTNPNSNDGKDVTTSELSTQTFWQNTVGYDFTKTWYWDEEENIPKLQVFMPVQIVSISLPDSPSAADSPLVASVVAESLGLVAYQWQVSVDNCETWTDISGATSATLSYTPSFTGNVWVRVLLDGGRTISAPLSSRIVSSLNGVYVYTSSGWVLAKNMSVYDGTQWR